MATKLVFCGKKVNLPAVREQAFYLTTDTHEVYFGQNLYTEPVRFVTERETTPAQGVLYILPSGLGEVYDGSAWKTVIKPTVTTIEDGVTDEQIATAKAVKDYVDNLVTGGIGALGALAKKDKVTETELGDALKKKINDAAAQASTLVGEDASKSARAIAAEEVAKIVDGADSSFDTLKEIATYISTNETAMDALNEAIGKKANKATTLEGYGITDSMTAAQINKAIQDALAAATGGESAADVKVALENYKSSNDTRVKAIEDDYLKAADKTALQGNIDAAKEIANAKSKIYYSATEPAGLAEGDLWVHLQA